MKRLAALAVPAVLAASFTLPASAAETVTCGQTGRLSCTITQPVCHAAGGKYGHGYMTFVATLTEYGRSGVTRMRQQAQYQLRIGGQWQPQTAVKVVTTGRFPDNSLDFTFTYHWRADFGGNAGGRARSVVWRGSWLPVGASSRTYREVCARHERPA